MRERFRALVALVALAALGFSPTAPARAAAATPAPHATKKAAAHPGKTPPKKTKPAQHNANPSPKPTPSPPPTVNGVESFWGFGSALLTFDRTHTDGSKKDWAVRAFVETDSDDVVLATLVAATPKHPHATLYARPVTYGGHKGIVISIVLLGKDPAKSELLAAGEHVTVRVLQRHARHFSPPVQFRDETQ